MMECEINSQNIIIDELIKRYIVNYCVLADIPLEIKRISIVASGSSHNAGLFGKYFFETISDIETEVSFASEFSLSALSNFSKDTFYIFISQSGESTDTVASMNKVKNSGCSVCCITNNPESTMYMNADYKFDIKAGVEKAIAATKTFSATVLMLWLLAIKAAQNKKIDVSDEVKTIYQLPSAIQSTLTEIEGLDYAVSLLSEQKEFSIAGFSKNYALSREAALKIKETSYINTGSYPLGEFIHGHFALLNKSKVFMTFLIGEVTDFEKRTLKKIMRIYSPQTVIITDSYDDYDADITVKIPKTDSKISAVMTSIAAVQTLALKTALKLKRDVDKPAGLNKVVKERQES